MNKYITILLLMIALSACNEVGTGSSPASSSSSSNVTSPDSVATITEITASTKSIKEDYQESSYSKYILFHKSEDKVLIDYDFFPTGSDLCQQATYDQNTNPNGCQVDASIVIPCDQQTNDEDELLSISISAQTDNTGHPDCDEDIIVDLSEASFTIDGLVFSFSDSLDTFNDDFEFALKKGAVVDIKDDSELTFDSTEVGFEEIQKLIQSKRIS